MKIVISINSNIFKIAMHLDKLKNVWLYINEIVKISTILKSDKWKGIKNKSINKYNEVYKVW